MRRCTGRDATAATGRLPTHQPATPDQTKPNLDSTTTTSRYALLLAPDLYANISHRSTVERYIRIDKTYTNTNIVRTSSLRRIYHCLKLVDPY